MRLAMVLALLLCPLCAAASVAEEEFPYTGYINADSVPVHADYVGQGEPTGTLAKGTPVEVYRHELNGWCAIRPPAGSFSWVSARHLTNPDENHLAEVLDDRVGSWVGTTLSDARLARHVSLKRGEVVELLAAHEFVIAGRRESWYKISPPAGEFRWIQVAVIDRDAPEVESQDLAGGEATAAGSTPVISALAVESLDAANSTVMQASDIRLAEWIARPESSRPARPPTATAAMPATRTNTPAISQTQTSTRRPSKVVVLPIQQNPEQPADAAPSPLPSRETAPPRPYAASTAEEQEELLQQLDLDLSYAVSNEPNLSKLVALRERTERLINEGSNVKIRARARLLQDKVRKFEEIHRRYELLASGATPAAASSEVSATLHDPPGNPALLGKPQFDGQGWLMPLVSNKQNRRAGDVNLPPFALTDDHGNVLQLVSPAPGMNLRRYVRTRVGVFGQRGYVPHLQANHLTARQIVSLDKTQQ